MNSVEGKYCLKLHLTFYLLYNLFICSFIVLWGKRLCSFSLWWSRFDDLFVAYSWGLRLQSVMSCWLTRCCSMHWKAFVWIECNILVIQGPRTILVSCRLNYCLQTRTNWKKKKKKKEHLVLVPVMQKVNKICLWKNGGQFVNALFYQMLF